MNYNFQAGQSVSVTWDRSIQKISTVERVTNTLAIVDGIRYSRSTGRKSGKYYGTNRIEPSTPAIIAKFKLSQKRKMVILFLGKYLDGNWRSLPSEDLDKMAIVLGFQS